MVTVENVEGNFCQQAVTNVKEQIGSAEMNKRGKEKGNEYVIVEMFLNSVLQTSSWKYIAVYEEKWERGYYLAFSNSHNFPLVRDKSEYTIITKFLIGDGQNPIACKFLPKDWVKIIGFSYFIKLYFSLPSLWVLPKWLNIDTFLCINWNVKKQNLIIYW